MQQEVALQSALDGAIGWSGGSSSLRLGRKWIGCGMGIMAVIAGMGVLIIVWL